MANRDAQDDEIDGIRLTHPEKVLFAGAGITKLDLAEYLVTVGERMLAHVSGRPLSLVRCPEGTAKECFFQKHMSKGMPPALKSVPVEEDNGKVAQYLMIDSAAGLVGAAQIGGLGRECKHAPAAILRRCLSRHCGISQARRDRARCA